ncbi:hypothetical protein M0R45_030963 [Rubus argutus]|uniref:Uncharacterized protein n=1 Tax=Rubus argutus TaxID=59490 RepID=A0AAW1WCX2_RUBAR
MAVLKAKVRAGCIEIGRGRRPWLSEGGWCAQIMNGIEERVERGARASCFVIELMVITGRAQRWIGLLFFSVFCFVSFLGLNREHGLRGPWGDL